MDRNALGVGDDQPVSRHAALEGGQREVAQVLVVDRVELAPVEQVLDVRHLDHGNPGRSEHLGHARDEPVEVRHVREHVVGVEHVCPQALSGERAPRGAAEEGRPRRDPVRLCDGRDVRGRLDAQDPDSGLPVCAQEVPVVAGRLDHEARRSESPLDREPPREVGCVPHHRLRGRGAVHVLPEQRLGRDDLLDLHQRAARAEPKVERIDLFVAGGIVVGEKRICERRRSEREDVHQRLLPARPALERAQRSASRSSCRTYQGIVSRRPSSSVNRGDQPRTRRALSAARLWYAISCRASSRTSGSSSYARSSR